MNITLTQTRQPTSRTRYVPLRAFAFVDSNALNWADDFFSENKIFQLDFKSKTWNSVCRAVNQMIIAALETALPEGTEIKFSRTTYCSCGCSPCFVLKGAGLGSEDRFYNIEFDLFPLESKKATWLKKLKEEIENNSVVVV